MIIMGVDPALASPTGAALIDMEPQTPKVLQLELHQPRPMPTWDVPQIHLLTAWIIERVKDWTPDLICVESPFAMAGRESGGLAVAKAMTAVICGAWVAHPDTPIHKVAPTEVKRAISGKGRASKDQVRMALNARLGVQFANDTPSHITDAAAIGIVGHEAYRAWRITNDEA